MRITELIRDILDIIDGAERQHPNDSVEDKGYQEVDIKRFRQIVDLANNAEDGGYSNEPKEQYADIDAVTQDAGADSWQGTKDPADIRGEHPSIYPGSEYPKRKQ